MLEFKNINAYYGKNKVINNANLKVYDNKINTIIGLNGSGKTSLISTIFDNIKYEGSIVCDNIDIRSLKLKERASLISLCPQIKENISYNAYLLVSLSRYPYNGAFKGLTCEDEAIIKDAMVKTSTYQFKDKDILELSGGERQRVYLAMCLAQNTKYIVLDEPTTFLDVNASNEFINILKEMNKTVLIIVHDLSLAYRISDYITIVKDNQIVGTFTKEEIKNKEIIESYFNVKKYIIDDKVFFE